MNNQEEIEKVIIVGVETPQNFKNFTTSFKELAKLATVAGGEVIATIRQNREKIDSKTLIGKGKLEELQTMIEQKEAVTVIFNQRLTPRQQLILERTLKIKVIDRMQLILDIFALRAKSSEGQLQVELAQLNYLLPRLAGQSIGLSRQAGGIGSRGPGEKKLETDRRHIESRILQIKQDLKAVERKRALNREERLNSGVYKIGLVGYTNAGKSTIFEQLTKEATLVKDQLFATLDPLSKKIEFDNGFQAVLTDTVGFIQDLPIELIQAFHSTLEESKYSNLLIHVVDASHPDYQLHEETVLQILETLGMSAIPMITVYNKKDLITDNQTNHFGSLLISSLDTADINLLKEKIIDLVSKEFIPFEKMYQAHESYQIYELKKRLIIIEEHFDESRQIYIIKGFVDKAHYWLVESDTN
ncbi:MAG: GTPase HflX [Streptococcaceae bacterium]|nr:GTPase HflX [Streptococcaceae bacterium]